MGRSFSTNTVIEHLDLRDTLLTNMDMQHIAPAAHSAHVRGGNVTLDVRENDLGEHVISDLTTSFEKRMIV